MLCLKFDDASVCASEKVKCNLRIGLEPVEARACSIVMLIG